MGKYLTRVRSPLAMVALCVVLGACALPSHYTAGDLDRSSGSPDIVALSPDIELSELRASGITELNAAWTKSAINHFGTALDDKVGDLGAGVSIVNVDPSELGRQDPVVRLMKLHGAVGAAIAQHYFIPALRLPHKEDQFDWTLGPGVAVIREKYDADYALFIYVRDSYTSAGRAAAIFVAAMFGVGIQGGVQEGYASLVDLSTGEIVWFNRMFRGTGDMRTADGAKETLDVLLKNFPS